MDTHSLGMVELNCGQFVGLENMSISEPTAVPTEKRYHASRLGILTAS